MYFTQSLHRNLQQQPNEAAFVCGELTSTYAQTAERVSRLAGGFRALGADDGDRIAVLALNSHRYLETMLATAWAGAVIVPVNIRWNVKEIAYSLVDAGVRLLLVDDAFSELVGELRTRCPALQVVIHWGEKSTPPRMLGYESLIKDTAGISDAYRSGDSLAGIFYTGGTTGLPKGVMLSHRNLMASAAGSAAAGAWARGGRVLHVAPMFHLAGIAQFIGKFMLGGTNVVLGAFDPVAVLKTIEERQITDILLVPTMIQMVVDHPRCSDFEVSSLRNLMYGASPISEALLLRARSVFSEAKFVQAYGMTELSPSATMLLDEEHNNPVHRRSAGRAAPHSLVKIVGPDDSELSCGTVGEIVVSGDHVMLGYWNKPDESADAVRDGWMHTGDGGYMDEDGYVFVVDRIKDMIVTGGENVYSAEVENVLARHPAITQCAVIGVPDDRWGERVHAVVSLAPGTTLTVAELADHARQDIAGYKVPRSMSIVEEFPISAAGKILKRVLREQFSDGTAKS